MTRDAVLQLAAPALRHAVQAVANVAARPLRVRPLVAVTCFAAVAASALAGLSQVIPSSAQAAFPHPVPHAPVHAVDRSASGRIPDEPAAQLASARFTPETPAAEPATPRNIPAEPVELLQNEPTPALVRPVVAATPQKVAPKTKVMWMEVTAYCACPKCCGEDANGVTASGKTVRYNRSRFVAADTRVLPFGTKISIPDYHGGLQVEVIDRGRDIKGNRLDVFFPSHKVAKEFGRRWVKVTVAAK